MYIYDYGRTPDGPTSTTGSLTHRIEQIDGRIGIAVGTELTSPNASVRLTAEPDEERFTELAEQLAANTREIGN